MCVLSSLAQGRGKMKCVLIRNANMNAQGRENRGCVLVMDAEREVLERKKGKEKTDEGSSVLLYFMTEEGERE